MSRSGTDPVRAVQSIARGVWNLPRYVLMGLLMAYRKTISPLYGPVCRFFPSCSAYALEAVTVHGAVRGTWLAARRLVRCHPWNDGGVDHVPPGHRIWDQEKVPRIIVLNHPVIPADEDSREAA
ncbi:membrane protein insertion efficiency factor YidD [Arthrobacter sp. zg-Y820]|uniref:membrane protein insertion efficiency factor YidD n=1 Tax=unclassified Arthrobacter TaxID=235627 RepID=UPI001E5B8401|nr:MULTISPECIES: membrane protein insertion efficiency factor YidD [unclassified Arthrobacter]MCC9197367.1 membrane protein insertion efficiency factor YidD [Arthrobacter sp. zg-Y820]MDK1280233.1 membrane protein insertion efficiency factor YidD [Arthrobacter sp. zg.Y820]MDK1360630.1 membrane protein insertion efficiency factor YidD [Arthrobacter sp. zg-Y1219]WIB09524.1 membrane protein insertion efficiency factor YidD [Arthrobacter sp. zg-Y820]